MSQDVCNVAFLSYRLLADRHGHPFHPYQSFGTLTVVWPEEKVTALVGHRFPGGRYTVSEEANRELCDVVRAPVPADGRAHPIGAFLAAQGGVGITLDDVFALVGASAADGPMLGEWSAELPMGPLRAGVEYAVTATVEDAVRKRGVRAGTFDVVTTRMDLTDPDGAAAATVRSSIVYPRREDT